MTASCVSSYGTHSYSHIRHIDDLLKPFENELEDFFFVNYHELGRKSYRILGVKRHAQARHHVKNCRRAARGRKQS